MTAQLPRSPLGEAIKALPRRFYEYEVQGYFALGHDVRKVAIRVPTKREQDLALLGAAKYVEKLAEGTPALANDPDVVQDAKSAFIVAACCFDPSSPDMMPVWPTGNVVSEDVTPDRIAVLVRFINEVRAKDGPVKIELDSDRVEAIARAAAVGADTDVPDDMLASLPHPYLVQLYIMTAVKYQAAKRELEALKTEPEAEAEPDVPSNG